MSKGSPEFRQICTVGPIYGAAWNRVLCRHCEVGFLHRNKQYIFGLSFSVAWFWYKEYIGAITVLRLKEAQNFLVNLHCQPYTALHENGHFADPYCEVGFLHRIKDYTFGFSIPVASFWYKECIRAMTEPWLKEAPMFGKSALSALYGATWKRAFCWPLLRSGLFAPNQGLRFWVLNTRSFLLMYKMHWCNHGTKVKESPKFR